MEKCTKRFLLKEEQPGIEIMALFGWSVLSREEKKDKVTVYFQRENKNEKLDFLEKIYSPKKVIPLWVLIFIALIIVALVTTFVVRFALRGEGYNKIVEFACFMLPSLLLILIDAGVFMIRYLCIMKNIENLNSVSHIRNEVEKVNG